MSQATEAGAAGVRARADLLRLAGDALARSECAQTEVLLSETVQELTRFAGNAIHQNVSERSLQWRARVIADSRVGVASVHGEDGGARVVERAAAARRVQPVTETSPLPTPTAAPDAPVAFAQPTADATPEQRAEMVAAVVGAASRRGLSAYGFASTQTSALAIVNSTGLRRHAVSTQAGLLVVMRGASGSGYAARYAADITDIDAAACATEAEETCLRNQEAIAGEPGVHEVVLSPYAVAELLGHLSWVGFGALAVQEQRSFMRLGERAMSEAITIVDDARTDVLFPFPFDAEGVSTQPVTLIDRGVCSGLVYDTPTAVRDGVASTGHSLPQPNTVGPFARHMLMGAGELSLDELLAPVRRGLYVTRLWYVRDVHPLHTIVTGMTRDGTFLIEDGKLGRPVRDLRFTQGITAALADVRGVSRERRLELAEDESAVLSPWLHLGAFSFTS